jgi:microcystin-dependent protein
MSEPFVGQVVAVGFNFAPIGWVKCDGSLLQISEYSALFQLLGTTFGGDGVSTFAVPDLRGRVVVGAGQGPGLSNYVQGQAGGVDSVSLTGNQNGAHTHPVIAAGIVDPGIFIADPEPTMAMGSPGTNNFYATTGTPTTLAQSTVAPVGGGAPHENRQPYQTINYIIATEGIFPSPS